MKVGKSSWRSLVSSCFKGDAQAKKSKRNSVAKQSSLQRLSVPDLSNPSSTTLSEDLSKSLAGSDIHEFTMAELKVITQSFSSANFIGEGGFGPVHKGFIDDNLRPGLLKAQPVAVKHLDLDGLQGHKEWLAEVLVLAKFRHVNLVKLIGYCCEKDNRLLVYEYMPRGSLENQLFRRYSVSLPWLTRIKIALGAAKGLAFLHEAKKSVIYRDFKASNILLDSDYTPKLSDFGLAKDGPEGSETHVSTRVMGTQGYAAPEYILTGHLTAISDVYSFGVVLLELITGRRSVDRSRPEREQYLAEWAKPLLNDHRRLSRIIDPKLEEQYSEIGVQKAAALAYQCLSHRPRNRPTMSVVVKTLEDIMEHTDLPIGTFVYTVPAEPEAIVLYQDDSKGKDLPKDSKKDERGHRAHRHKHRSPRSPTIHSEQVLHQNLRNGQNSPMQRKATAV